MRYTLTLLVVAACSFLIYTPNLNAQNQQHISIQGTLKDGNGNALQDGTVNITFKLYDAGTEVWTETTEVDVFGGIYSHNLGSETPFDNTSIFKNTLYLGVTVGSGQELAPRTELTYAPYAISVGSAQQVATGGCSGQVGDIKYSILKPTDFARENGDCWIPMDGRAIANSKLAGYGFSNAPDMSGLFIRAAEYSDGNDPHRTTTTAAGTFQDDALEQHNHSVTYNDKHLSKVQTKTNPTTFHANETYSIPDNGWTSTQSGQGYLWTGDNDEGGGTTFGLDFHGVTASRTSTSNNTGSTETRPKNMNFYLYIRIN